MLVENIRMAPRSIGALVLIPGYNQISDDRWDEISSSPKWKAPVEALIESGQIVVSDARKKLTIAVVKKTYDEDLLKSWEEDSANKGPLRGAIKEQLIAMRIGEDL